MYSPILMGKDALGLGEGGCEEACGGVYRYGPGVDDDNTKFISTVSTPGVDDATTEFVSTVSTPGVGDGIIEFVSTVSAA